MARNYTRRRRGSRLGNIVSSIKNTVDTTASTGTTLTANVVAISKDAPLTSINNDVKRGCIIKALWISFDVCGLGGTGVLQRTGLYLIKNEGNNLTPPGVFTVGSSNEKKFVIRQWQYMTMRNQDGNPPNHFEDWIPIPKRYQRMGTDDRWQLVVETTTAAGHFSGQFIYKWYT